MRFLLVFIISVLVVAFIFLGMAFILVPDSKTVIIDIVKVKEEPKGNLFCEDTPQFEYLDEKLHAVLTTRNYCKTVADCTAVTPIAHCEYGVNVHYAELVQGLSDKLGKLSCSYKFSTILDSCGGKYAATKELACVENRCLAYNLRTLPSPPKSHIPKLKVENHEPIVLSKSTKVD